MNQAVRIKSYPNKIVLYLDHSLDFDSLLEEIKEKFKEVSKFFGNAKMILSLTGRELTEEEEYAIIKTITACSSIEILYLDNPLAGKREEPAEVKPVTETKEPATKTNTETVRFYKSSLSDGDILESPCDIVILGNVAAGASIFSQQSIYIYGGLYGEACAGYESGSEYVVSALDFKPTRVTIGELEYTPKKSVKWPGKSHFMPQIAYIKDDKIITEQITKDLLDSLI